MFIENMLKYEIGSFGQGSGANNPFYHQPGAYIIHHPATGRMYVGSTGQIGARLICHKSHLGTGQHTCGPLQAAFQASPHIDFYICPVAAKKDAIFLEQQLANELQPLGLLFNIGVVDVTRPMFGLPATPQRIERVRQSVQKHYDNRSPERIQRDLERMRKTQQQFVIRNSVSVMCEGTKYPSIKEAAKALNMSGPGIAHRCSSPKYPDYFIDSSS